MEGNEQTVITRYSDREVGWEDTSMVIDLLKQWRHTTEYEPRVIPREWLTQILAAARWSSSIYNSQPWHFIVVADRAVHRQLQDAVWQARKKLRRWRFLLGFFKKSLRDPGFKTSLKKANAPQRVIFDHTVVILSCMDPSKPEAMPSTAMALNNMALEATRLGMGCALTSATQSLRFVKGYAESIGVPAGHEIFLGLMVGFPKRGVDVPKGARKEVMEISHWV